MPERRRWQHRLHYAAVRALYRIQSPLGGEPVALIVLGALTGVVSGLGAVLFVRLLFALTALAWHGTFSWHEVSIVEAIGLDPPAYSVGIVVVGMVLAAAITRRFAPDAAGHGVPEVMAAVAERSGRMRSRVGWVKLVASALNIGLGGSVGKEGPIVQVGSAFGSALGRLFAVRGQHLRTLVGCGAAAGIAAVFNAPIGGVMFALEIIVGGFQLAAFSPIVIASVFGSITARQFLGAEPMFDIPEALRSGLTVVSHWEVVPYTVLGLLCGVTSVGFTRALYFLEDRFESWRSHWAAKAALAGVVVGGVGLLLPRVLGEGNDTLTQVLVEDASALPWTLLLVLAAAKLFATSVTIAGGGSGGVFAPSLFVGAMLGGAFGQAVGAVAPGYVGGWGAYALVGMAGLLAGTAHAPLTGILLLFEMSDNYRLMLPLMTTAVIATVVSTRLLPVSIYTLKLARRGVLLRPHRDRTLLRRLRVSDAMGPPAEAIGADDTFDRVVRRMLASDLHDFPVVEEDGRLLGALSLDEVREFLRDDRLATLLLARECVHPVETVSPRDSLFDALAVFERGNAYEVPVVSRRGGGQLVGSLRRRDVMRTYRRALIEDLKQEGTR